LVLFFGLLKSFPLCSKVVSGEEDFRVSWNIRKSTWVLHAKRQPKSTNDTYNTLDTFHHDVKRDEGVEEKKKICVRRKKERKKKKVIFISSPSRHIMRNSKLPRFSLHPAGCFCMKLKSWHFCDTWTEIVWYLG
jgi:hypothetical protein